MDYLEMARMMAR